MLTFSKMSVDDVKKVAEIEVEVFQKNAWSYNLLLEEINQEEKFYLVAKLDDSIIGYGGFAKIFDEGHIMNIAIVSNFRRLGYGAKLVEELKILAKNNGVEKMTLEVRESNFGARKLYENANFLFVGTRKKYYNNTENACIYWIDL